MEGMFTGPGWGAGGRFPHTGFLDPENGGDSFLEKARAQLMWDRIASITSPGGGGGGGGGGSSSPHTPHHHHSSLPTIAGLPAIYAGLSSISAGGAGGSPPRPPPIPPQLWSQWTALHGLNVQAMANHITQHSSFSAAAAALHRPIFPQPLNLHRYSPYFLPKGSDTNRDGNGE